MHKVWQMSYHQLEHRKYRSHLICRLVLPDHHLLQPFVVVVTITTIFLLLSWREKNSNIRTAHAPPPLRCFHHFVFNVARTPVSWSRKIPSLNCGWYLKSGSLRHIFHWHGSKMWFKQSKQRFGSFWNFEAILSRSDNNLGYLVL